MTRSPLLVFTLLLLQGCASIAVTPPQKRELHRSRIYERSFDKTWSRAVDWYAEHNVIIEKIEKNSGLLTARYLLETNSTYLDCGEIKTQGTLGNPVIKRLGTLNLTVRRVDEGKTQVNVNFFGGFELRAHDAWDGRPVVRDGHCVSTGQLEQKILDAIGGW